jgi:hypothetical protein
MSEYEQKVLVALLGALAGGFMSLLINLLMIVFFPRLRRWNSTRKLSIITDPPHNGNARFRVVNGGYWTVSDATLYLQLDMQEEDVLPPPNGISVHIAPGRFVPLDGDQLCWSIRAPMMNPMKVAILAKERQPFSPCQIHADGILIPTEEGWPPAHARVFLRRRVYTGRLTLVSADTDARAFRIRIDPDSRAQPCLITPI